MPHPLRDALAKVQWILEAFSVRRRDYGVVIAGRVAAHGIGLVAPFASMAIVDRVVPSGSHASLIALITVIALAHVLGTGRRACGRVPFRRQDNFG